MNAVLKEMTPCSAMDLAEQARKLARKGEDIIHLEVCEPDFGVHPLIAAAIKAAFDEPSAPFADIFGDPELRAAICRLHKQEYGTEITPERVLVTSGSASAMLLVLQALCSNEDEILSATPGPARYRNLALACQARPIDISAAADNDFQLDLAEIKAVLTPRTRALFVNSPANPTGKLADPDLLKALPELFPGNAANAPVLLSDETYHGIVYGGKRAHSILEYTDEAFVFADFSSRFVRTGLDLGYVIIPKRHLRPLRLLQQSLSSGAGVSAIAQRAALVALQLLLGEHRQSAQFQADQAALLAEYDSRRKFIMARIRDLGMSVPVEPEGTFFVFADARRYTNDSLNFAQNALARAHVAFTPGTDFGARGQGFLRFSYAAPIPRIREAFNRMAEV
ncbi:MAG: aminotransferase class I/II-fold pyridoxal phosphate-dependent enzyme [Kiritimatiellae bacterium]|nr:aminotransferase class I/II-fold pyridoxal phosphate-dependent enzyme [Kiritimatiellia bacterium]